MVLYCQSQRTYTLDNVHREFVNPEKLLSMSSRYSRVVVLNALPLTLNDSVVLKESHFQMLVVLCNEPIRGVHPLDFVTDGPSQAFSWKGCLFIAPSHEWEDRLGVGFLHTFLVQFDGNWLSTVKLMMYSGPVSMVGDLQPTPDPNPASLNTPLLSWTSRRPSSAPLIPQIGPVKTERGRRVLSLVTREGSTGEP